MQKFQRISKIDSKEIRQSINDFEEYLRELVEDIDEPEDDHLIEGKCKKCEEWNK